MSYSAPDFLKVSVSVEDSFATYSEHCELVTGKTFLVGGCETASDFKNFTEVYVASPFICYDGKNS